MRKDNYVVGYKQTNHPVFGKEENGRDWVYPITLTKAKKEIRTFSDKGAKIFKLVEIVEDKV